jgi:hypothetical protein
VVALGEFVMVEDGRCGVLVPPPSRDVLLVASPGQTVDDDDAVVAVWFGEIAGDEPVVELVLWSAVRRPESTDVPLYYH